MGLQFAPTLASEQPALIEFLSRVFAAGPQLNSFQPRVLEWKYFSPHPEWPHPRSFLLKNKQEIVAHGGVWPFRLRVDGSDVQAIHLIDWAGSAAFLGAGVHILRNIAVMCDVMVTVGGSQDTRKILPKLGYRHGGTLRRYVRVVRPWLQVRTRQSHDWKSPLRFLRSSIALFKPLPEIPRAWRVDKVAEFKAEIEPLLQPCRSSQPIPSARTAANLNYVLTCPAAEFSAYVVSEEGGPPLGYFIVSKIGRQARIVDIGTYKDDVRLLLSVCNAAAQRAGRDPDIAEMVAGTSSENLGPIFQQLGFRLCREDEILYYDRCNLLPPDTRLDLNLIDGDHSFIYNADHPYIS